MDKIYIFLAMVLIVLSLASCAGEDNVAGEAMRLSKSSITPTISKANVIMSPEHCTEALPQECQNYVVVRPSDLECDCSSELQIIEDIEIDIYSMFDSMNIDDLSCSAGNAQISGKTRDKYNVVINGIIVIDIGKENKKKAYADGGTYGICGLEDGKHSLTLITPSGKTISRIVEIPPYGKTIGLKLED